MDTIGSFSPHLPTRTFAFLLSVARPGGCTLGTTTRDLDLWVHAAPANLEALSPCLIRWKQRYPSHTSLSLEQLRPLRRNLQIPLPDADVYYLRDDGELARLSVDERIGVLTSVQAVPDAEFSNYYARAATHEIDGFALRIVAIEDLDVVSSPK